MSDATGHRWSDGGWMMYHAGLTSRLYPPYCVKCNQQEGEAGKTCPVPDEEHKRREGL